MDDRTDLEKDYDALAARLAEAQGDLRAANETVNQLERRCLALEDRAKKAEARLLVTERLLSENLDARQHEAAQMADAIRLLNLAEHYLDARTSGMSGDPLQPITDEIREWLMRPTVSATVVQYKPCEICTTQSWCETHGCQCYPVSAVQPERCCLDYPRCDCNSPPEPDSAPTLQPCGHPWKAQHDFKCILCSSPGDATYAQLAEEQRFLHGAAAVTGLTQQDYDALVRDAMLWRTRSPTGAGGNARAFVCCEGVGQHAPGCIAQESAP